MALSRGKCLLRYIRQSSGLTQELLSQVVLEKTGLSISTVMLSQFENTKRLMSPEQMRALCIVLNCSEVDLYEWPM
ncbi:helix-turn-helix domain-containing protein [Paenibacillus sp. NPDC058367]|uniref:helix-turn-helix domain-containing protein n=1 Tax=Paenibacillus sp. NPDC058367 TaxID=3346460 RepID=UPI00365B32CC